MRERATAALDALLEPLDLRVAETARRDLLAWLDARLAEITQPIDALERRAALALGAPSPHEPGSWRRHAGAWPVVEVLAEQVFSRWWAAASELLTRVARDRPQPGALCGVTPDCGDRHHGGRAVAILRFEDGARCVYKPKDLRVAAVFLELVRWLNARGLPWPLATRWMRARAAYAWEEYVPFRECAAHGGVTRFYHRLGEQLRLFQLLEARDMWLDNLVAAGEHPVFVDLEMLLQPRRAGRPHATPAAREADRRLRESPVNVGILSMPVVVRPGQPPEDLGAMTPPRKFRSPVPGGDGWIRHEYTPHLAGVPARSADHLSPLLEGYRAMHATLLRHRGALSAPDGPVEALAALPVRFIHRHTWGCLRILRASLAPSLLRTPGAREAALTHLLAAEPAWPALGSADVAAFRALDVPYLQARPNSDALLIPDGPTLPHFFDRAAIHRVRDRLRSLEDFDVSEQEDLIRSALDTGYPPPEPLPAEAGQRGDPAGPIHGQRAAAALEGVLAAAAIEVDGSRAWLGRVPVPADGPERIDVVTEADCVATPTADERTLRRRLAAHEATGRWFPERRGPDHHDPRALHALARAARQ